MTTQSASEDETDPNPWLQSRSPPGLQSSVCAKLLETSEQQNSSTTNRLDFSTIVEPSVEPLVQSLIPPAPALPQCQSLSLDINVRTIAAYQKKPKLMYTFRCAQEFRRDEYEWHYRNVHNDIHGGIDGWIEHRCPLWQYGCNFVHKRWNPTPEGSRIVFNELIESFGLKMPESTAQDYSDSQSVTLSLLPFEVWTDLSKKLFTFNGMSIFEGFPLKILFI